MNAIEWTLFVLVVCVIGVCLYLLTEGGGSPTIEIKKSDFACTEKATQRRLRPQLVGKVTVMVPYNDEICTNYKRVAP